MSKKVEVNEEHYKRLKYEPKDIIRDWDLSFNLGNALKYIARAEHKGDKLGDLQKAINFIEYEKEYTHKEMREDEEVVIEVEEIKVTNQDLSDFVDFCFMFQVKPSPFNLGLWYKNIRRSENEKK